MSFHFVYSPQLFAQPVDPKKKYRFRALNDVKP